MPECSTSGEKDAPSLPPEVLCPPLDTVPPYPQGVMSRADWGAVPPYRPKPQLPRPVQWVKLTYNTNTARCTTTAQCIRVVKDLQWRHIQVAGADDIQYNFMIGGDGLVYEGRGWKNAPENVIPQIRPWQDKYLDIAFIGEDKAFTVPPSHGMYKAAWHLIKYGVEKKYVSYEITRHGLEMGAQDTATTFTLQPWKMSNTPLKLGVETDAVATLVGRHYRSFVDDKPATVVSRSEWGAKPALHTAPMPGQINHVLYVYQTHTDSCSTLAECSARLRDLQRKCFDKNKSDIFYNFMVGGDGRVYECRGWSVLPDPYLRLEDLLDPASLYIGYMGDFADLIPNIKQWHAGWKILEHGFRNNLISEPNFRMFYC